MIPAETIERATAVSILEVARQAGAQLRKVGNEWNGPCPACGGHDRFWLNEAKNVFLCRMSDAKGSPIELIRHRHQCGFAEAVEMLTGERAMPATAAAQPRKVDPDAENRYREKARRRAWEIWRNGHAIEPSLGGRLVSAYFQRRGIPFPNWRIKALRETRQLAYWHYSRERGESVVIHRGPAMLAAIVGPDGHFIGIHRTWLDLSRPNGKAQISDPDTGEILAAKKVEGSQRGGRIVLREGGSRDMALGEGIETVLSWDALRQTGAQLICGVNLDNIAGKAAEQVRHPSLTIRDSIGRTRAVRIAGPEPDLSDTGCLQLQRGSFDRLILLGDGDSDKFTTQAAMLRARCRHAAAGHNATIDWARDGTDFNVMLRDRPMTGTAA